MPAGMCTGPSNPLKRTTLLDAAKCKTKLYIFIGFISWKGKGRSTHHSVRELWLYRFIITDFRSQDQIFPLHTKKEWAKPQCSVDTSSKNISYRYVQKHNCVCKITLCGETRKQQQFVLFVDKDVIYNTHLMSSLGQWENMHLSDILRSVCISIGCDSIWNNVVFPKLDNGMWWRLLLWCVKQ